MRKYEKTSVWSSDAVSHLSYLKNICKVKSEYVVQFKISIALLRIFLLFIQGSGHFPYPGFVGKTDRVTDKVNDVTESAFLVYHGVVGDLKHPNMEQSFQESN